MAQWDAYENFYSLRPKKKVKTKISMIIKYIIIIFYEKWSSVELKVLDKFSIQKNWWFLTDGPKKNTIDQNSNEVTTLFQICYTLNCLINFQVKNLIRKRKSTNTFKFSLDLVKIKRPLSQILFIRVWISRILRVNNVDLSRFISTSETLWSELQIKYFIANLHHWTIDHVDHLKLRMD